MTLTGLLILACGFVFMALAEVPEIKRRIRGNGVGSYLPPPYDTLGTGPTGLGCWRR